MKYEYIIWDLDGTLLDTSCGIEKSVDYTTDIMGLKKLPWEIKREFIGPPIYDSFKQYYHMDENEANRATQIFRDAYKDRFLFEAVPYDGIYKVLEILKDKGCKNAVATNKREDYAQILLREFEFDKYFDFMLGSDFENKLTKKDIIERSLILLKMKDRKKAVMIGDTRQDYIGATGCGIEFIGVNYGFGFSDKGIDAESEIILVSKPIDIARIILG